jgi:transcriptional regulator with XRE-family HTH domain
MASSLPAPIDGRAILNARLRKGWTQRQVADRCEELGQRVDDTFISRCERGAAIRPSPRFLPVLATALDLEFDDLFMKEGAA